MLIQRLITIKTKINANANSSVKLQQSTTFLEVNLHVSLGFEEFIT